MSEFRCLQPNLCEYALSKDSGIDPELREWLVEKFGLFQNKFGEGIINFNTNRYKAASNLIGVEPMRTQRVLRVAYTNNLITPTEKVSGNTFLLSEAGQVATLALLGIDQDLGRSDNEFDKSAIFLSQDLDTLAKKTIDALGQSCIRHYYNVSQESNQTSTTTIIMRPNQIIPAIPQSTSAETEVVSETEVIDDKSSITTIPLIQRFPYYRSFLEVTEEKSKNPQSPKTDNPVPPEKPVEAFKINGINFRSFDPQALQELKAVNISQLNYLVDQQNKQGAMTDTSQLSHGLTIFLEYYANIAIADRVIAGMNTEYAGMFKNDTDLTINQAKNLCIQLNEAYARALAQIPQDQQEKYANPSLFGLLQRIAKLRRAKGLPF